jgi:hypothetical protein
MKTNYKLIKLIAPSFRTHDDPAICVMDDNSACAYTPISIGDLKLTTLIRKKFYSHRKQPAIIGKPDPNKKLTVIVPYRFREQHLQVFPQKIKAFLANEGIANEIIIIEQADDGKPFNKAKLLNVGATLARNNCDYYCFHDINMLPEIASYAYINHPVLLANSVSQFDKNPNHATYFGGVILFDKHMFFKINGFSNRYWHWGCEDDDLLLRCMYKGLIPLAYTQGRFSSLEHEFSITRDPQGNYHSDSKTKNEMQELYLKNKKYYKQVRRGVIDIDQDGLNSLSFSILKQEQYDLFTKITVEI